MLFIYDWFWGYRGLAVRMSAVCRGELGRETGFATSMVGFIPKPERLIWEYLLGMERATELGCLGEADEGVYWLSSTAKES